MMLKSLRGRLFIILVAATGLIWLCATAWIFLQTRSEVERVLDTRLQEAARMVSSLAVNADVPSPAGGQPGPALVPERAGYERQLSCQIWSLDGRLVARSSGAPDDSLGNQKEGFSDQQVGGETWRVYAISDSAKGLRVLVGDRLGLREKLVSDLIGGLLWPAIFIVPLLGLLIWTSLGRGLRPLQHLAGDLQDRSIDDMKPIDLNHTPPEILPLVDSLNNLFARLEAARRHEREITAFAAHELRTPLAGLKTQAQVAIATTDPAARESALRHIVASVDRTARLVRQLLAMARLDAQSEVELKDEVNLARLLEEITSPDRAAGLARVVLDPSLDDVTLVTNRDLLTISLRNLHENALQHMRKAGVVKWSATTGNSRAAITIDDEGPGIPENELLLVTNRFFRGQHKSPSGTGLGLAIVQLALEKIGGSLALENRPGHRGLRATVSLPAARRMGVRIPPSAFALPQSADFDGGR
jgi:two-component system, OmpR family, sensor histidine kinase QseC